MLFSVRRIVACLAMVVLPLAAGCGGDAEETTPGPAAIDGSKADKARSSTNSGAPASKQPDAEPLNPTVVIETSLGTISVELDREKAPLTVDNFLSYVDSGHYEQTIFHQVVKDYPKVVLGGAFTAELSEKKAHLPIYNEAHNGLKNLRGTIAMAREADAIHSATCYFFLNLTDNEVLDHKDQSLDGYGYCVFGKITDGIKVADKIAEVEVHDTEQFERIPVQTVMIRSARQIR